MQKIKISVNAETNSNLICKMNKTNIIKTRLSL